MPFRYILASGSPRRKELIAQVGIPARICPAVGKETSGQKDPRAYATDLARHKAQEIAAQEAAAPGDYCIIGADTIVVLDGMILGKPKDRADARRMLTLLQGRSHEVITGVCLDFRQGGICRQCSFSEVSTVKVVPMSQAEIERYLATGEADDKAGAYGIQGAFGVYVAGIEGDYYNIVGLPISRLYQTMKEAGLLPELLT
ncbi:MAG: Maf family protein [Lachnospiraceae bacterium]